MSTYTTTEINSSQWQSLETDTTVSGYEKYIKNLNISNYSRFVVFSNSKRINVLPKNAVLIFNRNKLMFFEKIIHYYENEF